MQQLLIYINFRLLIKNLYAYLVLLQSYDENILQRIAHAYFVATGPCYVIGNLIGVVLLGGRLTSLVPRPHVWERDYRLTRKTTPSMITKGRGVGNDELG